MTWWISKPHLLHRYHARLAVHAAKTGDLLAEYLSHRYVVGDDALKMGMSIQLSIVFFLP